MAMDVHVGSKGIHQHSSIIKGLNKISGSKTLKKLVSITCECTKLNPEWHKLLHHMCECMWKKEAIWKSAPSWSSWWVSRRSIWGGKSPKRGHRKKTTCWTNAVLIIHKWLWISQSSTPDLLLMSFFWHLRFSMCPFCWKGHTRFASQHVSAVFSVTWWRVGTVSKTCKKNGSNRAGEWVTWSVVPEQWWKHLV